MAQREQDSKDPEQGQDDQEDGAPAAPAPWEWAIAGVGALLVAGTLGWLTVHALAGEDAPPSPELTVLDVQRQDTRYLVRVQVRNRGQEPAADLRVVGTLQDGGRTVEEAETEFQYVPGGSTREAGLFFASDPRRLRLELTARSYQAP